MTTLLLIILSRLPSGLKEANLLAEARLERRVGEAEFADALTKLKTAGMIESKENPVTSDLYWNITEAGTAYITKGNK